MNEALNFALGIVGVAGFLLALCLAWVEWHRYRISLQVVLREIHYSGSSKGTHLVLLWLAFVNPSSAGKTVFHIRGGAPNNEVFSICPYQYDRERDIVTCLLPELPTAPQIAKSELLWLPLDIPPNQSAIKALPVLIKTENSANSHPQVHLHLKVFDVLGKQLAEIDQDIELKTYQLSL
jgi:hypothetical protein